jgi:hypothetical protein
MFKAKIVQFKNGTYGYRKFSLFDFEYIFMDTLGCFNIIGEQEKFWYQFHDLKLIKKLITPTKKQEIDYGKII